MKRRHFLTGLAALALAACASTPPSQAPTAGFTSDRIEVARRGEGAHVILIPGLTSHRDVWATTADALDDRYTVHVVQVKGFAGFPAEANAEGAVSAPVAASASASAAARASGSAPISTEGYATDRALV